MMTVNVRIGALIVLMGALISLYGAAALPYVFYTSETAFSIAYHGTPAYVPETIPLIIHPLLLWSQLVVVALLAFGALIRGFWGVKHYPIGSSNYRIAPSLWFVLSSLTLATLLLIYNSNVQIHEYGARAGFWTYICGMVLAIIGSLIEFFSRAAIQPQP